MKLYDVASPAMQKQIDKAANLAFLKSGKTPTLLNGLRKSMDELRSEIAGYARQDVSKQMPAQAREFRAVPVQNLAPIAAGQKDRNGVVASEPEWMLWETSLFLQTRSAHKEMTNSSLHHHLQCQTKRSLQQNEEVTHGS